MNNNQYKEETRIREIANNYHNTGDDYHLDDFYKEASRLTSYLYNKLTKNKKMNDIKEDVIHDVLTSVILNLKKGSINVEETKWTRYLTIIIRNRLSWTHPLNGLYGYRRELEAFKKNDNNMNYNTGTYKYHEDDNNGNNSINSLHLVDDYFHNNIDLSNFIEAFCVRSREKLPLDTLASQNIFIFMSLVSLFEEDMSNLVFVERSGFINGLIATRFNFLHTYLCLDFKKLLRKFIEDA
jgi:hypothetical protein